MAKTDIDEVLTVLSGMTPEQRWALGRMLQLARTPNVTVEGVRAGLRLGFEIAARAARRCDLGDFASQLEASSAHLCDTLEKHGIPGR